MTTIHASWIRSFAARLMQLRPATTPLDAVRDATSAFDLSSRLAPEEAAEVFASAEEPQTAGPTAD
jgi:hypothetical protein